MTLTGEGVAFTVETCATREEWLAARRTGLGGSDAVNLWSPEIVKAGGATHGSPYSTWCDKRGLLPEEEGPEPVYLRLGRRMEQVIADEYAEATGAALYYPGPHTLLRSVEWPFLVVSLDRMISSSTPGILECKNRGVGASSDWRDGLPLAVQVQIAHGLLVTGWTWGEGAAVIGGNRFVRHRYDRDDGFLSAHLDACQELWARVQSGDPPPVDGHEATRKALARRWPQDDGQTVEASTELADWVEVWERARQEMTSKAQFVDDLEAHIRSAMGPASWAALPDGRRFQLRTQTRAPRVCECGRQIAAGSSSRVPRIVKGTK